MATEHLYIRKEIHLQMVHVPTVLVYCLVDGFSGIQKQHASILMNSSPNSCPAKHPVNPSPRQWQSIPLLLACEWKTKPPGSAEIWVLWRAIHEDGVPNSNLERRGWKYISFFLTQRIHVCLSTFGRFL